MTAKPQPHSLLEELDRTQDEVLQSLDDLDARIHDLIKQCLSAHGQELTLVAGDAAVPAAA